MKPRKNNHVDASRQSKLSKRFEGSEGPPAFAEDKKSLPPREHLYDISRRREQLAMEQFSHSFSASQQRVLVKALDAFLITQVFYVERLNLTPEAKMQFIDVASDCFFFACTTAKRCSIERENPHRCLNGVWLQVGGNVRFDVVAAASAGIIGGRR